MSTLEYMRLCFSVSPYSYTPLFFTLSPCHQVHTHTVSPRHYFHTQENASLFLYVTIVIHTFIFEPTWCQFIHTHIHFSPYLVSIRSFMFDPAWYHFIRIHPYTASVFDRTSVNFDPYTPSCLTLPSVNWSTHFHFSPKLSFNLSVFFHTHLHFSPYLVSIVPNTPLFLTLPSVESSMHIISFPVSRCQRNRTHLQFYCISVSAWPDTPSSLTVSQWQHNRIHLQFVLYLRDSITGHTFLFFCISVPA